MGIKFRCPNGHKLNVKSFLAGKRGVCPKCGTSLRIPLESTRAQDAESPGDEGEGDDLLDEARFPAPGRASAMAAAAAAARPSVPSATASPAAVAVAAPAAIPVATTADPIAESPAAVWYVRPPGGDQYGPARGDIMRRWIAEGRVSTDSLVWREGWTDWLTASDVFPSLKPVPMQSPTAPSAPAAPAKEDAAPEAKNDTLPARSSRLTNRYEARRKQGSGMGIAVIVFLGLLCIVLAVLLAYVFVFSGSGDTKPGPKSQARLTSAAHAASSV